MTRHEFVLLPERDRNVRVEAQADPTLLLVESPGRDLERYRAVARRAGFRVVTASPGPMTRVVSQRSQPDLVLLPPLAGASELARSIKEDPKTMEIPVMILLDADASDPDMSLVYPTEACASAGASDDELVQIMRAVRSRRRRERVEPEPSSPLEGDLADDTFPGVLEFLFTARKTGRVVVLNGSRRPGHIYVEDGNVVHAELAEQTGVAAFDRMCFLKHGRFQFEPEFRASRQTMTKNGMEILLDCARRRDEQIQRNAGTASKAF